MYTGSCLPVCSGCGEVLISHHPLCCWPVPQVVGAIRHKRANGQMDGEYKHLLGKLLRLHPDYYSMWNFRKEAVLAEVGAKEERGVAVERGR